MERTEKNTPVRALVLITTEKLAEKASKLYHSESVPVHYKLGGTGTAPSEALDILGIGTPDKSILISLLPKSYADGALRSLRRELKFGIPGHGIAFTVPISSANNLILKVLKQFEELHISTETKETKAMADSKYAMIAAVVNQGYSEELMKAAREAGAGGGTVVHSRHIGDDQTTNLWGISFQEEKEIVLIVSRQEEKLAIMKAISENCGTHSDAKGIVLSLPIDAVTGLGEE